MGAAHPSRYHHEKIEEAYRLIEEARTLTDGQVIEKREQELLGRRFNIAKSIEECKGNKRRLEAMLQEAEAYQPPTADHTGIKEFMIQQLTDTIAFDAGTEYYDRELVKVEEELNSLDAVAIRKSMTESANKDLIYHKAELAKEEERCRQANEWVELFLNSLQKQSV